MTNGESSRENVGLTPAGMVSHWAQPKFTWELRLTEGVKAFFVKCV